MSIGKTGLFYLARSVAGLNLVQGLLREGALTRAVLIIGMDAPMVVVDQDLQDRLQIIRLRDLLAQRNCSEPEQREFSGFERLSACGSAMQWVMGTRWLVMQSYKGAFLVRKPAYSHAEIQSMVRSAYLNVRDLLLEQNPDLVFIENIGSFPIFILAELSHMQGRRTAYLAPIRFGKGLAFANTAYENSLPIYRCFLRARAEGRIAIGDAAWQRADKTVEDLQNSVVRFHDAAQMSGRGHTERALQKANLLRKLPKLLRLKSASVVSPKDALRAPNPRITALRILQTRWRRRLGDLGVNGFDQPLQGERYVFFALHSEPETALSLNTPWLQDQAAFVANLAYSVPLGTCVYVKDHPRMYGLRPLGYYRALAESYPNVRVLDPRSNALEIIHYASAVVTAAGTAGFEALLLGIPAVVLGASLYRHVRGVESALNIAQLPAALSRALGNEVPKQQIASDAHCFLAACFQQSIEIGWFSDLANANTGYNYQGDEFLRFAAFFSRHIHEALDDPAWSAPMRTGLDVEELLFATGSTC